MKGMRKEKKTLLNLILSVMCIILLLTPMAVYAEGEESDTAIMAENAIAPANVNETGYDIVLVADNSESIWFQQEARNQALRSISGLAAGSDIRIGAVYFAREIYATLGLTSVENKDGLEKVQQFLSMTDKNILNMDTNIGLALETALGLFANQDASRQKVVILFSDGLNTTADADAKTRQQVALLEEQGIPVYCVFLEKQKNQEGYLQEIVNYFKQENNYAQERFKKVSNENIDSLSDEFAKVFYSAQNNMKYSNISIDSTGTTNFYVPELGVTKLQMYLKNASEFGVKLEGPQEQDVQYWADGNNWYISVLDPVPGEWKLTISGDNPGQTKGTVAYYADLYAHAEVNGLQGTDGSKYKNESQGLTVHFFDKDKNVINPDGAANVVATVELATEAGEKTVEELVLTAKDTYYSSDRFVFDKYGTYSISVRITYEDFIDLTYQVESGTVVGRAPIVYDQSGVFAGEKVEKGLKFTFRTTDLYYEPDGETVKISVSQINESNPVEVVEKDGIVTVIAKKSGDVEFALQLEDETGATAQVLIAGKVENKVLMELVSSLIVLALVVVAASAIIKAKKKKSLVKAVEAQKKNMQDKCAALSAEASKIIKNSISEAEENWGGLIEAIQAFCEELTEEQTRHFGLFECLDEAYVEQKFADLKKIREFAAEKKEEAGEYSKIFKDKLQQESIKSLQNMLNTSKEEEKKLDKSMSLLAECRKNYAKMVEAFEEEFGIIGNQYMEAAMCVERPIECDISMECIEQRTQVKHLGDLNHTEVEGAYPLDSVHILSLNNPYMTLKDVLGNKTTGIYIYGYVSEEGVAGFELRSSKPFRVINTSGDPEGVKSTKAILEKGEQYKIMNADQTVVMIIDVL